MNRFCRKYGSPIPLDGIETTPLEPNNTLTLDSTDPPSRLTGLKLSWYCNGNGSCPLYGSIIPLDGIETVFLVWYDQGVNQ